MNDTPETDAQFKLFSEGDIERSNPLVSADFARKLERERDKARQKAEQCCRDWADDDTRVKEIAKGAGIDVEADAENDGYFRTVIDVAERMAERIENLEAATIHSCGTTCQRPACKMRRERDEAREDAERLYACLNSGHDQALRLHEALVEKYW